MQCASMSELLVCGAGMAGLLTAVMQARRGRTVTVFSDGRPLGGHFAGLRVDGHEFDLGMVLFEQHQPRVPCEHLAEYRPARRNDWTRFGHLATDWLRAQLPLRRVPTPACRVGGRVWPDYLISNRLDALEGAGLPAPAPVSKEDPRHAANKLMPGPFDTLNYAQAAHLNHGAEVHARYIEPFIRKLGGHGSNDILARLHRAAWVPLYHPETIAQALTGAPHALPEYPFWTSDSGCVSSWVQALQLELASAPGVSLVTSPLAGLRRSASGWLVETQDGRRFSAPHCLLSLPVDRACKLLGVPVEPAQPAVSVGMLMCSLPCGSSAQAQGCLMVVDDEFISYRLTSPDLLAGLDRPRWRVVLEFDPDRLAQRFPNAVAADVIVQELRSLWSLGPATDIQVHRQLLARHALVLPTTTTLDHAARTHDDLRDAAAGAWLTGHLLGYGVASLNDQIVQALHITEALSP